VYGIGSKDQGLRAKRRARNASPKLVGLGGPVGPRTSIAERDPASFKDAITPAGGVLGAVPAGWRWPELTPCSRCRISLWPDLNQMPRPDVAVLDAGFGDSARHRARGVRRRIRHARGHFLSPSQSRHQASPRAGPGLLGGSQWGPPRSSSIVPSRLKVDIVRPIADGIHPLRPS
jgi:hypothetical protein